MKHTRLLFLALALLPLVGCGTVLNAVGVGPAKEERAKRTADDVVDQAIETKAKVNVHAASKALDNSHFNVISYNGYVLLVGQVPDKESKSLAETTVSKIRGVRRIFNKLEIAENSSVMKRTSDDLATSRVKTNLRRAIKEVPASSMKVVSENGVVYLMGLVSRSEGKRIAEVARSSSGVEEVVEVFEYVD